ncbi:SDR family oxidoreductase [Phanerochaete sordida]|uniref:SDR family oxidoreductase n=1 Tax=Phanerochaete sordida TaxID=48140 RepID=A0A9P3GK44_9APHY|nr:SDR family oxidoreductase [Phanerochaete sordida]
MADKTITRRGRLQGKVCIVTGAGSPRGIGWSTIKRFADEGTRHIYAADINPANFVALREAFEETYKDAKITFVQADATDESAIQGLCERALKETGRLDVFFANAGIFGPLTPYDQTPLPDVVELLRVNVGSAFLAVKYASTAMTEVNEASGKVKSGGVVILTGSNSGLCGSKTGMGYSASKAAIHNLAKTGAYENASRGTGVRVNAIAPGPVGTDFLPAHLQPYVSTRPDIFCGPAEIADAVLFLASDESIFVNGQTVAADNGVTGGLYLEKLLD